MGNWSAESSDVTRRRRKKSDFRRDFSCFACLRRLPRILLVPQGSAAGAGQIQPPLVPAWALHGPKSDSNSSFSPMLFSSSLRPM